MNQFLPVTWSIRFFISYLFEICGIILSEAGGGDRGGRQEGDDRRQVERGGGGCRHS